MKNIIYIAFIAISIVLTSCNTTEKVLKSSDSNLKYTKAMEWYNDGQYFKAIPVFEELMGLFKGEKSTEEIYFYYCMANFKQGSHLMAAYHFKNYTSKHPYSKYAEEALFMHAESYNKQSLVYELDQRETVNAIEAYQEYIDKYTEGKHLATSNENIDVLRARLEKKALKAADLYYNTKNFRAAAFSYRNLLLDYPDIDGVKEIQFKIVKSFSKYAEQSIVSKQKERYEEAIKTAQNYIFRYPNSEYLEQIDNLNQLAHFNIIKSSYDFALSSVYLERKKQLKEIDDIYSIHAAKLKDAKLKESASHYLEKAYFQKIKMEYTQAQSIDITDRLSYYSNTIEAYNVFSTKYNSSKYINEAKRLFLAAEKNYKKYSNG